jgi:hypothetical protein
VVTRFYLAQENVLSYATTKRTISIHLHTGGNRAQRRRKPFQNGVFCRTKADRLVSGDPRLSLEERYGSHAGYVAVVRAAAEKAVKERFLLRDDADRSHTRSCQSGFDLQVARSCAPPARPPP